MTKGFDENKFVQQKFGGGIANQGATNQMSSLGANSLAGPNQWGNFMNSNTNTGKGGPAFGSSNL